MEHTYITNLKQLEAYEQEQIQMQISDLYRATLSGDELAKYDADQAALKQRKTELREQQLRGEIERELLKQARILRQTASSYYSRERDRI